jgi:hypothetical protein
MRLKGTISAGAAAALALSLGAADASAAVVTSLPGGTSETMPVTQYFGSGPVTFGADNLTWTSSYFFSVEGYNLGYGFVGNGDWSGGDGMIGLNWYVGTMDVKFSKPVSGVVAEINWAEPGFSEGLPVTLTAFNSANQLIDTIVFDNGSGSNLVAPGVWGFKDADISRIEFSNGFIGARDFSIIAGGVPEPGEWTLMLVGIGLIGAALRGNGRLNKTLEGLKA